MLQRVFILLSAYCVIAAVFFLNFIYLFCAPFVLWIIGEQDKNFFSVSPSGQAVATLILAIVSLYILYRYLWSRNFIDPSDYPRSKIYLLAFLLVPEVYAHTSKPYFLTDLLQYPVGMDEYHSLTEYTLATILGGLHWIIYTSWWVTFVAMMVLFFHGLKSRKKTT